MAATRLLRMSRPLGFAVENRVVGVSSTPKRLMCLNKGGLSSEVSSGERKMAAVKAAGCSSVVLEPKIDKGLDFGDLFAYVEALKKFVVQQRSWGFNVQMVLEKAIVDCRFFTLMAIGGSLLCSILCFLEGCLLVMGSYLQYFQQISDRGQLVLLLIEAIDMFIMGTAMIVFATALYVMFVGQNGPVSGEKSFKVMDAKSKIGHAVMLILQVQVLDKFKSIAVTNGLDLACFAGAIFLSSASIFLLSRIAVDRAKVT